MRYPATEAFAIVAIEDADNDGRPNLVLDHGAGLDDHGVDWSIGIVNTSIAHSLRDGTFSTTDSVAQGH